MDGRRDKALQHFNIWRIWRRLCAVITVTVEAVRRETLAAATVEAVLTRLWVCTCDLYRREGGGRINGMA